GIDDADFGEIQRVDPEYVITQKGIIDKEIFSFPINLAQDYDGNRVLFKVTEEEARNTYMQSQNIDGSSNGGIETETSTTTNDDELLSKIKEEKEIVIPLMVEELVVTKKELQDEITITKEPIRETKTEQVQLIHEEIEIERRKINNLSNSGNDDTSISKDVHPVETKTEIKIPLKREEAEVTKKPYVKEEVVVKKKTVTDKKEITDEVTSEELDTSNIDK
ncbi:MAG TPA: DUF2382 domain-containing protein, partial [Nitrososphaeraceae archaeon]|nr:DUF2382 domain-containing protein [Nitrososphaeraceae archaeon]